MAKELLEIRNLQVHFRLKEGLLKPVDGVDFDLVEGEILGIVGESGCGKTVTALAILRLIPQPHGRIVEGRIRFNGLDLLSLSDSEMRKIRGNDISMIFQEPMTSLNPVFRVGHQIAQAIRLHQGLSKKESMEQAIEMMRRVGIPSAELRARDYPHQLSGGMRQRVMIAMAMSCRPKLLIADEPTTALDVTIQAQILDLMKRLNEEIGTSVILITHNQGVIAENTQHVIVMYCGKIVESAGVKELFASPMHPYTRGLMKAIPDVNADAGCRRRLYVIPGMVMTPMNLPVGCRYKSRCSQAFEPCSEQEPPLFEARPGHWVRCWHYK
ncbi:MAG: ABC transporter ATP-binding protein [Deltaproteobacteria bacterium]|nr:ABC transporter ATP-binding protein [Deltaproteobacteria bacterium]